MRLSLILCTALLWTASATLPVHAAELASVSLKDTSMAGEQKLVLNGMGLRKKAIFKVYVGGLYLPEKQSDAQAIQSSDGAWQVVMHFVRNVGKESLCGGWDDGLANNTPKASPAVKEDFKHLCEWMEDVESDDQVVFTHTPGAGTEVEVKGQSKGSLKNAESSAALLACWLGPEPPSGDFKMGLLGK